jgi:hypothetical protein
MNSSGIASVMNDHINDSKTIVFTNSSPDMKSFTFPQVMRWTGSVMLICAGVFFMIQGFDSISFLTRHWIFTSIVFSMGGLGLFTGLKLKEIRGARVLLGLSAALIPVLFSQMGALVQSVLPQSQVSLPKAIMAEPESPLIILITTISTIALIIPVVFFGFKVLAHSRSSVLSVTYLLLNAVLLIPGFYVLPEELPAGCGQHCNFNHSQSGYFSQLSVSQH